MTPVTRNSDVIKRRHCRVRLKSELLSCCLPSIIKSHIYSTIYLLQIPIGSRQPIQTVSNGSLFSKREVKRKQKMMKYNILRKKMMPSGPPERNLTWDAMETIRYLKREHPDEWTVARLSEGFSVSDDVIRRVLRTKFTPAPQRRDAQDAKVMSRLQHPMLSPGTAQSKQVLTPGTAQSKQMLSPGTVQSKQMLSPGTAQSKQMLSPGTAQSKQMLSPGTAQSKQALSPGTAQSKPALQAGGSLHQPEPSRNPEAALIPVALHESEAPTKVSALVKVPETMPNRCEDSAVPTAEPAQITSAHNDVAKEEGELWDGQVFSEEELDEFKDIEPTPVLQHGHDFFDGNGHFLYRI
ncbi:neugrin isoform X2 [Stigmatopora argus]